MSCRTESNLGFDEIMRYYVFIFVIFFELKKEKQRGTVRIIINILYSTCTTTSVAVEEALIWYQSNLGSIFTARTVKKVD